MRYVDSLKAPVKRVRQNDYKIILLQSSCCDPFSLRGGPPPSPSVSGGNTRLRRSVYEIEPVWLNEAVRLTSVKLASQPFSLVPSRRAEENSGAPFRAQFG
jgi:hypothetical protein